MPWSESRVGVTESSQVIEGDDPDEEAFYDALADRSEVLLSMGDVMLRKLASELTEKLCNNTTVDWQFRDSVRAKMKILILQLFRKCKYPPEGCEEAIALVLKQAEAQADDRTCGEGSREMLSAHSALSYIPAAAHCPRL